MIRITLQIYACLLEKSVYQIKHSISCSLNAVFNGAKGLKIKLLYYLIPFSNIYNMMQHCLELCSLHRNHVKKAEENNFLTVLIWFMVIKFVFMIYKATELILCDSKESILDIPSLSK